MPTTAYISRRVVLPTGLEPAAILVDQTSGLITQITPADTPPPADTTIDLGTLALLPGFIDPHVHINAPGRTTWETFPTATRAAAAAGITTLIDMPLNCLPETTTVEALTLKRHHAAAQTYVDWRPWGGATVDNLGHLLPLAEAGVPGFKCFLLYPGCEGLSQIDEPTLRRAMPLITRTGLPLLVHAELAPFLASPLGDPTHYATYLATRPDLAELEAVALMIGLCREFRTRVHIVHVSSAQCLPLIAAAKAEGLPLTAETCPHYLYFAAERIPNGATLLKCAPPIRAEANRHLLWQALQDGTLDLIASDHSPCPPEMKGLTDGNFLTAWGGIASLSLGPSITWTAMPTRSLADLALPDLARWLSTAPATLAGLAHTKGQITPGHQADLVVFDPEATFKVTPTHLPYLHPISPYLGETLTGIVRQTILRAHTIYRDGLILDPPIGQEAS